MLSVSNLSHCPKSRPWLHPLKVLFHKLYAQCFLKDNRNVHHFMQVIDVSASPSLMVVG